MKKWILGVLLGVMVITAGTVTVLASDELVTEMLPEDEQQTLLLEQGESATQENLGEGSSGEDTAVLADASEDSVEATTDGGTSIENPLTPNKGSATIVEYDKGDGTNHVKDLIKDIQTKEPGATAESVNDVPTVQHVENYQINDEKEGALVEDYWQREDNSTPVEIDTSLYPLPKNQTTVVEETVGNIKTKVTTYESTNAIQKAIDKTLSNLADGAVSATIKVDEGVYDGDIKITNTSIIRSSFDWSKFTLYVLTSDSYKEAANGQLIDKSTINAGGSGIATINGKVTINGVNTVLSGLTYTDDEGILIDGGSVKILGTTSDDNMIVSVSDNKELCIITGDGNDEVKVTSVDGADSVGNEYYVYTNAGDDVVNIDVSTADNYKIVIVDAGEGIDVLNLTGSLKDGGAGSTVSAGTVPTIKLNNEDGNLIDVRPLNVENYIDDLEGKPEVKLTAADIKNGVVKVNAGTRSFVNYVIDAKSNTFKDGNVLNDVQVNILGPVILTSLVIDNPFWCWQ